MATTTRLLLRSSKPIQLAPSPPSSSSNSLYMKCVRYQSMASLNENHHNIGSVKGERKPVGAVKATIATTNHITTSKPVIQQGLSDLATLIASIRNAVLVFLRTFVKRKPRNLRPQMLIEKAIIDCRFFTLFAVAGSLIGSVLCFVEGCLLVIESYAHYFHMLSQRLDQGHLVHLLIEAIDSFLMGTALLIFGVGIYVMFVGSSTTSKETQPQLCGSNLLGLFYMKSPPRWVGMQSIAQAKSKIGHAVMMILQVGLLDKFKDIPLVTGLDLACFAAAVLTSSACIFVLSKLHH
ncbi:hypothetical protein AAZX31_20G025600 [Glycine max]|uniref:Uncharacterized protein n=1 Tax=Glycine max TaxID=3847 RepID=K7N109_SOYBN|nr:uncharacterized protein LOC100777990 [Glycine max]KAG4909032.1 hypothetical protein JHK87_055148 [Glycine soja]KAG4906424.1 hypothetical protein JHK86_054908 [Glycine max]KAG4917597.1 hypothetical protein JHK85_055878 [Glycine max]KAG5076376.1 hypothetical protein JHK82_055071 [Glycine max]KAH1034273.1 hypothetical protein GYH30_054599 [Glycine max]|eukprot:XP_003556700.1 uncharacterized protein LOC100777990 [Glycine max]